jgi:hypothetical protein
VTLLNQAVSVADSTSDIEPAAVARSGLARVYLLAGDPAAALAASAAGREWPYPTEELTLLLLEALALLELDRIDDAEPASATRSPPRIRCWPSPTGTWPRCRLGPWR